VDARHFGRDDESSARVIYFPAQPAASPTAAMGLPLMNTPEEPVTTPPPQPDRRGLCLILLNRIVERVLEARGGEHGDVGRLRRSANEWRNEEPKSKRKHQAAPDGIWGNDGDSFGWSHMSQYHHDLLPHSQE
jgi:hypothetical protein